MQSPKSALSWPIRPFFVQEWCRGLLPLGHGCLGCEILEANIIQLFSNTSFEEEVYLDWRLWMTWITMMLHSMGKIYAWRPSTCSQEGQILDMFTYGLCQSIICGYWAKKGEGGGGSTQDWRKTYFCLKASIDYCPLHGEIALGMSESAFKKLFFNKSGGFSCKFDFTDIKLTFQWFDIVNSPDDCMFFGPPFSSNRPMELIFNRKTNLHEDNFKQRWRGWWCCTCHDCIVDTYHVWFISTTARDTCNDKFMNT